MTILEHVYAIQNILNKGRKSDDGKLSNELIIHYMNIARSLLLKREADSQKYINPSNYQGFCMPLCVSNWADCCNMPVEIQCPILKSKYKIPKAISGRTNIYLKVSYIDGREIGRTTHRSFRYRQHTISKKNKPGWFILNEHLYVTGVPENLLKTVWVDALFEDPTAIADIVSCGPSGDIQCYDPATQEYPIESYLVEGMYKLTMQHITPMFKFPDDVENNDRSTEITNDKE